jgi:hypothetical protein
MKWCDPPNSRPSSSIEYFLIASFLAVGWFPGLLQTTPGKQHEREDRDTTGITKGLKFQALGIPDLSGRPRLSLGGLRLTAEVQKYASQMWHSKTA